MFYSLIKGPSSCYTFICRNTKMGNHWLLYYCNSHTKQSNH